MYFLGVDIGSSSIKTAVLRVSEAGLPDAIIGKANIDYPTYYPIDDSSEQSADDWNHAAAVAIKGAVSSMSSEEKSKIAGISFSSQAGSIYPADENNKPLYNALTWMDRRAVAENEEKTAALGFANITSKSGWKPTPADCISKLLWLKKHESEVFSKAKHFYTTLESVTGFLCGNFVTDPTNIALTRLYDYKAGCYIPEALEFLGITEDMLPTVAPCGSPAGRLLKSAADKCGLPEGIPVYVGAHDQYCASIGSGVTEPGQLLIATGTAWVLFGVANSPIQKQPYPAPCKHPIDNRYGVMTSLAGCGKAIGLLASECNCTAAAFDLEIEMNGLKECRENNKSFFVCSLPEGIALPHKKGVCKPITLDGKKPAYEVALAAMESAVFEAKSVIDAFEDAGFPKKGELVISGGASKSRLWTGIVASVFSDRPICRLAEPDAPAFGAAMIAATSAGEFNSLTEAARLVRRIPIEPDAEAAEFYADKYRRYCDWALEK
jgi:xylulokinase